MLFYINNKFIDSLNAKISVYDLGFLRSYAVFDFLRTYNQKPFYLDDHLKRLLNSSKIIGLKHNYKLLQLKKIVIKTLKKNQSMSLGKEFNIRIILTGGNSLDFITPSKPNLIVMITPLKQLDKKLFEQGTKLITKVSERIFPQAKTIIYTEAVKFLQEAKRKGAIEVLLISKEGKVLECTTSNFFVVVNKKLITPPTDKILSGITRKIVINLAKKLKIPVIEREINFKEIKNFDEAFITATNKEILPIIKIDNIKISTQPGPITKSLITEFKKLVKKY
ncbi:MAG: branched chain amino acid aminotransferase [Candidatus Parcubacteria bacterium]|nr:MAG: branched chain amino acid aminotransferase [Candidatus Parcubacteria bacterium]